MKAKKIVPKGGRSIRMMPDLHGLMVKVVPQIEEHNLGSAYAEAVAEWIKRQMAGRPIIKAIVEQECNQYPEIKEWFSRAPTNLRMVK